jgi:adenylyl cyclase-associated protein
MGEISAIKDKNRTSKFFNNLSTVAEGIAALGWVVVSPTPGPHIADMRGGSEFYSNRILKDFKGKDQNQVDFVTHFNGFLKELQTYVKQNHTTGTTWNPRGEDATSFKSSGSSAPQTGSAPPPPPGPAPPPPPALDTSSSPTASSGPDMSAVLSALNKGEDVTKGLKKVTKDMKTKNRADKGPSIVPAVTKSETASAPKQTTKVTKPPKFALEGNKWTVEYQVGNKEIVIDQTEVKQTVYIYRCQNSVIQIKGKVNAVTVDECSKTGIVFENVVAAFEVVNCSSVEVQVLGKVPSIAIDKTSGCQVFLSKESLQTEIVTSKSSEMNVSFPVEGAEDIVEFAVPEQYKSVVRNGKLITELTSHV